MPDQDMIWRMSYRASRKAAAIADRHYNRQKPGTRLFSPPGRCLVLIADNMLWVTSWPFAEYVMHRWPGAWINSTFRKERDGLASEFILQAVAATRFYWRAVPLLGMVTFVDPRHTPGILVHGERVHGYSYGKAGFEHVGFTVGGLWAWQLAPDRMPAPRPAIGMQRTLPGATECPTK